MIKKYSPFIIIILVHAVFFYFAYQHQNIYLKDSYEYLNTAKNLSNEFLLYSGNIKNSFHAGLVSLRPPVYGLFIALVKTINTSNLAICFMQCVLSILSFILLIKVIDTLFKFKNKIWIAVAFLLFPTQFVYANMIMSEIVFQFLLLSFIYAHVVFFNTKNYTYLLFANLILCLLILTKPVALFILMVYLFYLFYLVFAKKFKVRLLFYPLISIFCLLSYQYYNYNKTGYFHYSSISSTYLLNYQLYPVLCDAVSTEYAENTLFIINKEAEKETTFEDYTQKRIALTSSELLKNKVSFSRLSVVGIFKFFIDFGGWDLNVFFNAHENNLSDLKKGSLLSLIKSFYFILIMIVNVILGVVLLYSIFKVKLLDHARLLCLLIVLTVAFASGLNGTARFKLPVYPLILIIALNELNRPQIKSYFKL